MVTIDDRQIPWHPELSLDQALAALPDGHIYAVVRMNGRLVSRPDFSSTLVPDNAVIEPLPLVAGG